LNESKTNRGAGGGEGGLVIQIAAGTRVYLACRPLPDHLPRETVQHPAACRCANCGGTSLMRIGTDVTEVLEYVPSHFKVIRHERPKLSCRTCETITEPPLPALPIERGRPGPGLLAQVLMAKYCDHLPLYRQSAGYQPHHRAAAVELAASAARLRPPDRCRR
jgi:transposase